MTGEQIASLIADAQENKHPSQHCLDCKEKQSCSFNPKQEGALIPFPVPQPGLFNWLYH